VYRTPCRPCCLAAMASRPSPASLPCTPLFRSAPDALAWALLPGADEALLAAYAGVEVVAHDEAVHAVRHSGLGLLADRVHGLVVDRKSTRLNSSHVKISYAVFCLKKKKA